MLTLYHFTSKGHLPLILAAGGLSRGEVPVLDGSRSFRGTWLTSDPEPAGHGLEASAVDKTEVRITIDFRDGPVRACKWLDFARDRTDRAVVEELARLAGGMKKARTWYVYPSLIPVSQFRSVELRDAYGTYASGSAEEMKALAPHPGLPDLKVLFIAGYAENAVVGDGHLDPGMQVMTKPFAMEALSARIRAILLD